jgi:hypothetical protein
MTAKEQFEKWWTIRKDPPDFIDWFWNRVNGLSAVLMVVIVGLCLVLGMLVNQLHATRIICGV